MKKLAIFFSKNAAKDIGTSLVQLSGFRETLRVNTWYLCNW